MSALVGPQDCKILRQLPAEDGAYLYRIKCVVESVERVAKEGELALRPSMGVGQWSWHESGRWNPKLESARMMYMLAQFVSPPAIKRVRLIVAMTGTMLAFAFVAAIVFVAWANRVMLSARQVYMEAITAVLLTATIAIISAFIAAAITGDSAISIGAGCIMLMPSAAVLVARLWRLTRPVVLEEGTASD
jgi:hypothetical protein